MNTFNEYSISLWKVRNELTHGKNQTEKRQKKSLKCYTQIEKLYARLRRNLTHKDKAILKLPKAIQKKKVLSQLTYG